MIKTSDCINAICKHFFDEEAENTELLRPRNWRRLSKKGSGQTIIRRFDNRVTGTIMVVTASEDVIYNVEEGVGPFTSIKARILELLNQGHSYYDLHYELFTDVDNWPILKLGDSFDGEIMDDKLDMENFEWLSVSDTEIQIACGGDWQEPYTLVIQLINGRLTVVKSTPGYPEGMSENEFLQKIQ